MIKVLYSQDDENNFTLLDVQGHAEYDDSGKDLVCASVSSIIFGFMNAIDETKEKVEIKDEGNRIIITNHSNNEVINDYFKLVLFQLKTIEESYGEFIKVERK